MKGRWLVVGISAAALLPVLALLLLVLWMGFWQNGPGEPIVYTINHYRKIFTDPFTYKTFLNTVGFADDGHARLAVFRCAHRLAGRTHGSAGKDILS